MFNSKTKSGPGAPSSDGSTLINSGTIIQGNIESNGDIRIDGTLKGNLRGRAKIIIGTDGVVEGDIEGLQADIMGHVTGTIRVKELLYLHGSTKVDGDIYAGKLQIEPTAVFNGKCNMGVNTNANASVVELNNGMANAVNQ
jgi:cytoskeletal protein CcmA (bactofilin family)